MDNLKKYFYDNINNVSILELNIFCRKKRDPGNQFRCRYKKGYDGLVNLEIMEFNNFISTTNTKKIISPFGKPYEIVYVTFCDIVTSKVKAGSKDDFILGVSCTSDIPYENLFEFEIDKSIDEFDDCPVCREILYDNNPVILECNHTICRDCLVEIVKTNPICPICRAPIGISN